MSSHSKSAPLQSAALAAVWNLIVGNAEGVAQLAKPDNLRHILTAMDMHPAVANVQLHGTNIVFAIAEYRSVSVHALCLHAR
jgi:hypothetical protein